MASSAKPVSKPRESTIGPNGRAPKPVAEATKNQMPIKASGHDDQPVYAAPFSTPATASAWITISQSTPTTPQNPTNTPQAGPRMGCAASLIATARSRTDHTRRHQVRAADEPASCAATAPNRAATDR